MSPFETAGDLPRVAVCVDLIRALDEKDPISEQVVMTELEQRTGAPCPRRAALAAMRAATERMHRDGEPGAEHVHGGWVRLDPAGMMRWADDRDRRATRQLTRRARGASVADPERLTGEQRLKRDFYLQADRKVSEITQRRTRRLRPLPPAVGQ